MKTFASVGLLILVILLSGCGTTTTTTALTNLLPGITYYDGPEELTGKLVFLVQHDYTVTSNSETAASIYEFDLSQKRLRKATDSPVGTLIAAREGDTLCVNYWLGKFGIGKATNVFIYSNAKEATQIVHLEGEPQNTIILGNHVFIELKGYDYPRPGYYLTQNSMPVETKIVDYDIAAGKLKPFNFTDADTNQPGEYGGIYRLGDLLYFHYSYQGAKTNAASKHNLTGDYSFDVRTGNISKVKDLDTRYEHFLFKTFDGNDIGFDGSGWPIEGSKLIFSSGKTLHRFGRACQLLQISPDRHFAFVESIEPVSSRKFSQLPGTIIIYYLVDVSNGKTRVLLKDETVVTTRSSMWGQLYWVSDWQ